MDFSKTRLSLNRPITSYAKVRHLLGPVLRTLPGKKRPKAGDYLNIGCGPFARPDFFNIDGDYHPGVDTICDLRKPLPCDDGVIAGVFTEHCVEHLEPADARRLAQELFRVMRPGAVARISVPDGAIYAHNYTAGREVPYAREGETPMESVNRIFYGSGHRHIYDFESLSRMLIGVGLTVERADFGKGHDPKLLIDQESRRVESLYVEAIKPA